MMYPCEHTWEQRGAERFCLKCHATAVPVPLLGLGFPWVHDDEDEGDSDDA